jgi:predicted deacylase
MKECVENATHAIDLHTGAIHRSNMPQIRCDMNKPETARMAESFGAPVIIDSKIRDGSLRQAADDLDIPIIIYEAGEALRFDERSIQAGVAGIRSVMRELDMLGQVRTKKKPIESLVVSSSAWTRAPISGIFHTRIRLGEIVEHDDLLGSIADPFGETEVEIFSRHKGMVIGRTYLPLVNEGDAVIHIAQTDAIEEAADTFAEFIDG